MDPHQDADKVMEFMLRHVPFDGWTLDSLKRGAHDAGISEQEAQELLGTKPIDFITYYSRMLDRQTLQHVQTMGLDNMKIRDRIATCVMTRLNLMLPYRDAAQKAASILALPLNAPTATKLMYETVNGMWYAAGDTSTDYNFYSKRSLLAMVYSSTLLYWFRDISAHQSDTRAFLDRRIENVMTIPQIKHKVKAACEKATEPLKKIFFK